MGIRSGPTSLKRVSSLLIFIFSFEGGSVRGIFPFVNDEVDGLGPTVFDVCPGGIEMAVIGNNFIRSADEFEEDAFAGSALVGGDDMFESGNLLQSGFEAVVAACSGVGFIAAHDTRPLFTAHCSGAAVGEQVDEDIFGRYEKDVQARALQSVFPFLGSGHFQGARRL